MTFSVFARGAMTFDDTRGVGNGHEEFIENVKRGMDSDRFVDDAATPAIDVVEHPFRKATVGRGRRVFVGD